MWWTDLIYLVVGCLGGIIIGALGSGSSLIILPALSLIFPLIFPANLALKMAVGTCLATLIIGAISGAASYLKAGHHDNTLLKLCLHGVILGGIVAPFTAHYLPTGLLKWYIGLYIFIMGVYKLIKLFQHRHKHIETKPLQPALIFTVSFVSACLSGMAGVALGIIMIPFLSRYADHKSVVGSNLVLAVPYAIIGSIGYATSGLSVTHSIPASLGYIYLPAFIFISITMLIFPPLGLRLVKEVPVRRMQTIFYTYLVIIGAIIVV